MPQDPDLFSARGEAERKAAAPLADRMRPTSFGEFVGQDEIVGEGSLLRRAIEEDRLVSMIFWGPPGTGKTTLARIIAGNTGRRFVAISAVLSGVKELRQIIADAQETLKFDGRRTILFIDEIHRFNKAQQDALLPHVETGTVTLIGATTEIGSKWDLVRPAMMRARVVLPEPGGPQKTIEGS